MYKKIDKRKFIRGILKGEKNFFLVPCNCHVESMFAQNVLLKEGEYTTKEQIQNYLNHVSYYNCNDELGNRLNYYVKE